MKKNTMEQMKRIIEEKKKKSASQGYTKVIEGKPLDGARKAFKTKKTGGLFDK